MKSKRLVMIGSLVMVLVLFVAAAAAYACTSVVVGKKASVDGSVMTSHTCDGGYDFRLTIVPGQSHKPGEMRPVYKGGGESPEIAAPLTKVGEIPQVAQTYTYFNIAYPFMNEHQVMMGETTIGGRQELRNPDGWFEIWELQRVALERAKTAREAIQIMGSLAEEYGYGDWGECLTVTDPNEAWVFEIFGAGPLKKGAVWAAQRVPDDEVFVSANRSRIGEVRLDDPDNFMASKNIFEVAQQLGLWDPSQGPLVVSKVYGPKQSFYNSRREWRVLSLIAPSLNLDPWADEYPFSVKPDKKVSVQDVMAILRDHYEGTEFDLTKGLAAGPFGTPNRYATSTKLGEWERAISMFRCSYSFVSQSRSWLPNPIGGVVWFGEDAPHSTCYIPLYCGITKVPESFQIGQRNIYDRKSAWWAFNFVSNWADLKYCYMIKDIQAVYNAFESEAFAMQPIIEKAAKELYDKDPSLAVKFLTNYSNDLATRVVDAYWQLADRLIAKYNDGYVDGKTVGYPEEWLKAVGFGKIVKPAGK
ncbi:MAG TPA: peptidase C69 [Firmicutes bacterium]|nr:peptidase C69 [Bacillota bacterium]